MPIPVINYSAQTPQGDPWARSIMPAISQGLELGNRPRQMSDENERSRLANALSQIQLDYAPEMSEQALLQNQLNNKFMPDEKQSQIDQRRAQTGLMGEQARVIPLTTALAVANNMRLQNRFGQDYMLSKTLGNMSQGERSAWISSHPEEYTNMLNNMASQVGREMPGERLLSDAVTRYSGAQSQDDSGYALNLSPEQEQNLVSAGIASYSENRSPFQQDFKTTPEQVDMMRKASEISALKNLTTTATQQQMEGAIQIEHMVNNPEFLRKAKSASSMAGLVGKGKKTLSQLSQTNPEAYEDYISFKNHDMIAVLNRIKQLEGMGSSDSQRKEMESMYTKTMDNFTSNPRQFMTQLGNLTNLLKRVGESVEASYNPLGFESRLPEFESISKQRYDRATDSFIDY